MIVVMRAGASRDEIDRVLNKVASLGLQAHVSEGSERTIIGLIGDVRSLDPNHFTSYPGVERAMRVANPFKLVSKAFRAERTAVPINGLAVGGERLAVIAGPCAVENEETYLEAAREVARRGAAMLRGGAFKPRTSPYSFQGLGRRGLAILAEARRQTGLPVVTEVLSEHEIEAVAEVADVLQVGARSMHNYALLAELGRAGKPVMLKRGMMSSVEEWLMSAEYLLSNGNDRVILCERGIRTFETYTRNTLDLSAVPLVRELSHLPVVVDPSHGTGRSRLVPAMARAAVAAGADGVMVEVHPRPAEALCDGDQSLTVADFAAMMGELKPVAAAMGRRL